MFELGHLARPQPIDLLYFRFHGKLTKVAAEFFHEWPNIFQKVGQNWPFFLKKWPIMAKNSFINNRKLGKLSLHIP